MTRLAVLEPSREPSDLLRACLCKRAGLARCPFRRVSECLGSVK